MSEPTGPPSPTHSGLLRKKVAGVPVVYFAGGAVLILAFYAWHAKSTKAIDAAATDTADPSTLDAGSSPSQLPQGSVTVSQPNPFDPGSTATIPDVPTTPDAPAAPDAPIVPDAPADNTSWSAAAIAYLVQRGVSGYAAQTAIRAYLSGAQLTAEQGRYRDMVVQNFGLPPLAVEPGSALPVQVFDPPPVHPPTKTNLHPKPTKSTVKHAPVKRRTPVKPKHAAGGHSIKAIQAKVGVTQDGIYGPKSRAAVKAYQRAHGLVPDGIVGPLTRAKMFG